MAEEIVETKNGKIVIETYDRDMMNSMDSTDATTVQTLLEESKRRIDNERIEKKEHIQKKILNFFGILFLIISIGTIWYSAWYYTKLTVPIIDSHSIGVFSQTESFVGSITNVDTVIKTILAKKDLSISKPYLVPITVDTSSDTLISTYDLFKFLQIPADEPLQTSFSVIRFGIVELLDGIHPFVIGYVKDPIIANKEFLINESKFTKIFEKPLQINIANQKELIGSGFIQTTIFNLNFRVLKSDKTDPEKITMLYGNVTPNTVVFATNPDIIKDIYETLITQNIN